VEFVVRALGLLIHLAYFLVVLMIGEFRKRTFLFLHQVNLISLLYCLIYTAYINTRNPSFASDRLNNFLCTWCELTWAVLKFMRILSIFQLTIYRYLAMARLSFYKRLNQSVLRLFGIMAFSWILSLVVTLLLKFSLQTKYSIWYCIDGGSISLTISIIYYVCVVGITIAITVFNIIFGYKMRNRLKGSQVHSMLKTTRTNFKFIRNLFVLNCLMLAASASSLAIDFEVVILEQDEFRYLENILLIVRPSLRIIFIVIISVIPVSSLFIDHKKRIAFYVRTNVSCLLRPPTRINPVIVNTI
jgi:hypothetical protein